jgi:hypothetical protein
VKRPAPILFLSVLLAGATDLNYVWRGQVVWRRTRTSILDRIGSDRAP